MNRPHSRALPCFAVLLAGIAMAGEASHDISSDPGTDFRALHTFSVGAGQVSSRYFKPEIDNRLFLQRMQDSIRAALTAKGLKETTEHADVAVTFQVADADYATVARREPVRIPPSATERGFVIPGGPETELYTAGTLVIDLTSPAGTLLWRGTWHERQSSAPKLSSKLSEDARKLLSDYPPKRR